jgi:hypothetical protein
MLLWRYNVMWPDSGKGHWRPYARKWGIIHSSGLAVPALVGLLAVFIRRRADGLAIVALHVWAIIIIAALILGGVRFRAPYDVFIIILALEVYATAGAVLWRFARLRLARKSPDESSTSPSSGETAA